MLNEHILLTIKIKYGFLHYSALTYVQNVPVIKAHLHLTESMRKS